MKSRWQGRGACLRVVRDEKGEGLRLQQDVLHGGLHAHNSCTVCPAESSLQISTWWMDDGMLQQVINRCTPC